MMKFQFLNLALCWRRVISLLLAIIFVTEINLPTVSLAQSALNFTGGVVSLSPALQPVSLIGLTIHPDNPFEIDFIIDAGSELEDQALKAQTNKLIAYFLTALTTPENEMWVNLSPTEKDRIVPKHFGQTAMGRDLLQEDYFLKQLTASLLSPENETGKKLWEKIYTEAAKAGIKDIPVEMLSKVWIVPDQANVHVNGKNVVVVDSKLKVLMEDEYKKIEDGRGKIESGKALNLSSNFNLPSSMLKEILIPALTREVNEGKTFTTLRQITNAVILATWYKQNLKQSLLTQSYADQNKIEGIDLEDKDIPERIYNQYLDAFKQGVFETLKEEYDPQMQEVITKRYITGGADLAMTVEETNEGYLNPKHPLSAHVEIKAVGSDVAMMGEDVGLVFGKFAPFHNGHEMLIREALKHSKKVLLVLYDHPELTNIPAAEMAELIKKVIHDDRLEIKIAYNSPPPGESIKDRLAHMEYLKNLIPEGMKISKVFNNEWYGKDIAKALDAEVVQVDPERNDQPISATRIRRDPQKFADFMNPLVRERVLRPDTKMWEMSPLDQLMREPMDTTFIETPLSETERQALIADLKAKNPGYDEAKLLHQLPWDPTQYDKENLPSIVGEIKNKDQFSRQQGMRILDMVIRIPGQGWAIPKALEQFREAIKMAVDHQRAINPDFDEMYVYVTVDQKKVESGKSQRRVGWHGDAYVTPQTNKIDEEVITDDTYVMYDKLATLYSEGPFPLGGIDPTDDQKVLKRFDEIGNQKVPLRYPGYVMLRMTPYDVHTPDINETENLIERTFLKISFSREKYNMLGNALNKVEKDGKPVFSYSDWVWVHRDPFVRNSRNQVIDWEREDKDKFRSVNPKDINFAAEKPTEDWLSGEFFYAKKVEGVFAEEAQWGETLETVGEEGKHRATYNIAQKGDVKITTSQGDQYFLSEEKFRERYKVDRRFEKGFFNPLGIVSRMVMIKEPVRFQAPWGAWEYAPAGSILVKLNDNDIYAVLPQNFQASYRRTDKDGNVLLGEVLDATDIVKDVGPSRKTDIKEFITTHNDGLEGKPLHNASEVLDTKTIDLKTYSEEQLPAIVGEIDNKEDFSSFDGEKGARVLDLVVYVPGQGWKIPKELEPFREAIIKAVEIEQLSNPNWQERFVHITVDQKIVAPDQYGRREGLHIDIGLWDEENRQVDVTAENYRYLKLREGESTDHTYFVSDGLPTEYYPGPWNIKDLSDPAKKTFEKLAEGRKPTTFSNYQIAKLDYRHVHAAVRNETSQPIHRTFFKIQFTNRLLDRPINTVNPNFDYAQARAVSNLRRPGMGIVKLEEDRAVTATASENEVVMNKKEIVQKRRDALFQILEKQRVPITRRELWDRLKRVDGFWDVSLSNVISDSRRDSRLSEHEHLIVDYSALKKFDPDSAVMAEYQVTLTLAASTNGTQRWAAEVGRNGERLRNEFAIMPYGADLTPSQKIQAVNIYKEFYLSDNVKTMADLENPKNRTILILNNGNVIGFYHVRGGFPAANGVYVVHDFRGTGAVDILFEDMRQRLLNGDKHKSVKNLIARVSERVERRGTTQGTLDQIKWWMGIRSKVTVLAPIDQAVTAEEMPGGIDLNPAQLKMKKQGDAIQFDLPAGLQNFDAKAIQGFIPVIINITPITNFPLLLGLSEKEKMPQVSFNY